MRPFALLVGAVLAVGCVGGVAAVIGAAAGGTGGSPVVVDAGGPCVTQDPACPTFPNLLVCPWYDGGPCQVSQCVGPWRDCDHDVVDGCEVDTSTDPMHCGACYVACDGGQACEDGVCQ